ncbi:MAG: hypothetical protein JWO36_2679 [Myxococcales bacterium]|nr:hypothetical protein [Myxococcales bacterium]
MQKPIISRSSFGVLAGVVALIVTACDGKPGAGSVDSSVGLQPDSSVPPYMGGPDNTYCLAGNVANFGAVNDGPAALPTACFYTAVSATPSPGAMTPVPAGADLQAALNRAACGDTLLLAAGATFDQPTGLTFPAKNCDDQHWITVRTDAPDASLPPEGTRISPCYAGVSSLPGRPAFNCVTTQNVMPKIMIHPNTTLKIPGDHYRLIGLEVTRPVGGGIVYIIGDCSGGNNIIFDRDWMHGTATDELNHIILAPNATYVAAIDSYLSDAHCTAGTGSCTDSQAVSGGIGSSPNGPIKVVNNYIESAGEGILFGGGGATQVPHDIEVRRNFFNKPLIWKPGSPDFFGTTFVVKNNFELKNGQRVLLEGNVLNNVWGGFSQVGFQILLTPKSQNNQCPICTVADVTMRFNALSHSGAGISLAAVKSDSGGSSMGLHRVSIHDDVIDDVSQQSYNGDGTGIQIMALDAFQSFTINHITFVHADKNLFSMGGQPIPNGVLTNNLLSSGMYGAWDIGVGPSGCGYQLSGNAAALFTACWNPNTVGNNAVIAGNTQWPSGTQTTTDPTAVGFVNYNGGSGGDYHLATGSPYKGMGSDGKDIGADIDAVLHSTAGVASF